MSRGLVIAAPRLCQGLSSDAAFMSESVPQAGLEDDELTFTVHVEEEESPENLQWDIKKTYMDVIHFRNRWQVKGCASLKPRKLVLFLNSVFCRLFAQDSTSLPSIAALASELEVNAEVTEDTRASVEHFLQVRSFKQTIKPFIS